MNKDITSPPKTAPNRRIELSNDLAADVGMENDSVSLSLQETTEAEPGIEAETNMGSAADDGDHDQVEEQMRLMFSEESPHGQIFSAQQALEGSQENGRLQAEENGIKRGEQSKDVDRLEVAKVAGHNVGLGEMANLNSIIDSSGLISNRDSAENSTSKISVMGCDLNDKDEHKVVEQQVKEEVLCSQLAQELISKYKEPPAPLTDSTVKVELPSGCLSLPDTRSLEEEASDDDDVILMEELTEEDMQLALSRSAVGDIDEPRSEISGQEPLKSPAGISEDETDIFIKEVQEILDSAAIERGARKPGGLLGNAKTPRRDERYKARAKTEVSRGRREEMIVERMDEGQGGSKRTRRRSLSSEEKSGSSKKERMSAKIQGDRSSSKNPEVKRVRSKRSRENDSDGGRAPNSPLSKIPTLSRSMLYKDEVVSKRKRLTTEILEREGVDANLELEPLLRPLSELPVWVEAEDTKTLREETAQERKDREKREKRIARFSGGTGQLAVEELQELQGQDWQQLREVPYILRQVIMRQFII